MPEYVALPIKRVTLTARRGWDRLVKREGTNLTALAEALGRAFEAGTLPKNDQTWRAIFDDAKRVAAERRVRL